MTEAITPYIPPKRQVEILPVSSQMVEDYWNWFVVNRYAYLVQRHTPAPNGKYSYYAPKDKRTDVKLTLTPKDVELHLAGLKTISLYTIEPEHSTCKWIAIDADHDKAFSDLAAVQQDLKQEGIEALLEKSRRGGHLWIFAAEPLPAALCRILVYTLALSIGVPIKGFNHEVEGLEIFPKQDRLEEGFFGNAIRGPLGVHRATSNRYWFDRVSSNMRAQFDLIRNARRLTLAELEARTVGITMPSVDEPPPPVPAYIPSVGFRTSCIRHNPTRNHPQERQPKHVGAMPVMRKSRKGPRPGQPGYQEVRSSTVQVLGWMHERRHPRRLWSPSRTAILIQPLACNSGGRRRIAAATPTYCSTSTAPIQKDTYIW